MPKPVSAVSMQQVPSGAPSGAPAGESDGLIDRILRGNPPDDAPPAQTPPTQVTPVTPAAPAAPAAPVVSDDVEDLPGAAIPDGIMPGAKVEEPPPDPGEQEELEPEEVRRGDVKAKNAWTQTKAEKKALKLKVAELEAKLAESSGAQKLPEMQKLLELQQQVQQYEDQLGKLDITQSKSFKLRYDVPAERTLQRGAALLSKHGGLSTEDSKAIMRRLVDSAGDPDTMQGLIADQPVPVQGALYNLVADYEQLSKDREEALSNWRQTKLAMDESGNRDSEVQLAQNIEQDTAAAVSRAIKEGNWMYATTNGKNKDWDAAVQRRIDTVKGILRTSTNEELVKWVVEGMTAKDLRESLVTERQRAEGLLDQLRKRTGMRPGVSGAAPATPLVTGVEAGPKTPSSVIDQMFPG